MCLLVACCFLVFWVFLLFWWFSAFVCGFLVTLGFLLSWWFCLLGVFLVVVLHSVAFGALDVLVFVGFWFYVLCALCLVFWIWCFCFSGLLGFLVLVCTLLEFGV